MRKEASLLMQGIGCRQRTGVKKTVTFIQQSEILLSLTSILYVLITAEKNEARSDVAQMERAARFLRLFENGMETDPDGPV